MRKYYVSKKVFFALLIIQIPVFLVYLFLYLTSNPALIVDPEIIIIIGIVLIIEIYVFVIRPHFLKKDE